jgi:hypothetical protein
VVRPLGPAPVYDGHAALADLFFQPVIGDLVARAETCRCRNGVVAHRTPSGKPIPRWSGLARNAPRLGVHC